MKNLLTGILIVIFTSAISVMISRVVDNKWINPYFINAVLLSIVLLVFIIRKKRNETRTLK